MRLGASQILETDNRLIPTGTLLNVNETRFDYRAMREVGSQDFQGLDDTYMLDNEAVVAELIGDCSGIRMRVETDQPALVVFAPDRLREIRLRDAQSNDEYPAICFEAQYPPDAPNQPRFPSTLLELGTPYRQHTTFAFDQA